MDQIKSKLNLFALINYSGMATFFFLVTAVFFVLVMHNIRIHKAAGLAALTAGLIHGGLIFYKNMRIKARLSARPGARPAEKPVVAK